METNLTERVHIRIQPDLKDLIRKAATFSGQSLSDFMLSCAVEKARNVVKDHTSIQNLNLAKTEFLAHLDLWASGHIEKIPDQSIKRKAGSAKGKYTMSADFEAPLEGFEEYMP